MSKKIAVAVFAAFVAAWSLAPIAAEPAKKADVRIEDMLTRLGVKYTVNDSGNVAVSYGEDGDRSQTVYIMSETEKDNDVEIREIWSNAGTFSSAPDSDALVQLMLDNGSNKIGSWALEKADDGGYLLYYSMRFPSDVSDKAYQMMLELASSVADETEASLFDGADEN